MAKSISEVDGAQRAFERSSAYRRQFQGAGAKLWQQGMDLLAAIHGESQVAIAIEEIRSRPDIETIEKELTAPVTTKDWDAIQEEVKTPKKPKFTNPLSPAAFAVGLDVVSEELNARRMELFGNCATAAE